MGEDGRALTSAAAVFVNIEDADAFRDAVKIKCSNTLANIDTTELTVFADRAAYDTNQALEEDSPINSFGGSKKDALIVEVPLQRPVEQGGKRQRTEDIL